MKRQGWSSKILLAILAVSVWFNVAAVADDDPTVSKQEVKPYSEALSSALAAFVDIDGVKHDPLDERSLHATVLIFVLADCPISNSYAEEYNRLFDEYRSKGIGLYLVHPDPKLTKEEAARHKKEYRLKSPVVLDPGHAIVKATGATITPEAVVFNARGELVYRGRLDDRYIALGRRSERVASTELRDALNAIVEGRPILKSRAPAVGCSIKDLE